MTLTQALYDRICKEYHFELLILCNVDLGQDVMTFDYNAINDCIHVITGNRESFYRVRCGDYDDLYDELSSLINDNADFSNDYTIKEVTSFLEEEVGEFYAEKLSNVLRENDLLAAEKMAREIDGQFIIDGNKPVLTMTEEV